MGVSEDKKHEGHTIAKGVVDLENTTNPASEVLMLRI